MKTLDENVTPNRYPLGHMRLVSWTSTLAAVTVPFAAVAAVTVPFSGASLCSVGSSATSGSARRCVRRAYTSR
jgi:hypothetical protein